MCTLIVATRVWQGSPLVVAANRDERLARPAKGPALVVQGGVRFFAPRDLQAGGTWIGVNAFGVFAAITNRFGAATSAGSNRSRGLLVLDALSEDTAAHSVRRVASEAPSRHDPFHLVMADATDAHLVWSDGARVYHETLAPGLHVVTERSLGAAPSPRVERLRRELPRLFGPHPPGLAQWTSLLRVHDEAGLEGTCVHVPSHGYGTRSASVIELGRRAPQARWWHADGPPCTAEFTDLTGSLRTVFD